jgi:hypothetical protein
MARSFSKIVAFAFVLTFVFGMACTSQAQDAAKDVNKPLTQKGSAAMLFELAGIGTFGFSGPAVGPFGSAVGMKYFISDDMALFILAGLNTKSGDTTQPSTVSAKPSMTTFGIGAGIQAHFRPLYSTSPYVGGEVSFGSSSSDNGGSGAADRKNTASVFGVAAIAGFDWFFTPGLCLGGELSLGFSSTSASSTEPSESGSSVTTDMQSATTIALATGGSVHLDVYF